MFLIRLVGVVAFSVGGVSFALVYHTKLQKLSLRGSENFNSCDVFDAFIFCVGHLSRPICEKLLSNVGLRQEHP